MKDGISQFEASATQPRVIFKPGSWLAKIDFVNHLILFNNVLITVLAEKQGGKTSFNTLLKNNLEDQIKPLTISIKPPFDKQSMLKHIAEQLHLNYDENTDITSLIAQVNERKAHVALLIDDAQHLPELLIKDILLAIKSQENFGFFHFCFISDYSIVATLNHLAAGQFDNLIHTIELGTLNESETRTYVLQRAMASRLINKPLTDTQYKQFYQLTKGNLAKINNGLEAFITKCSAQKKTKRNLIFKSAALIASLAIVTGGTYLYYGVPLNILASERVVDAEIQKLNNENAALSALLESQIASWEDTSTRQIVEFALPKKQVLDELDLDNEDMNSTNVAIVDKVVVIPKIKANPVASNESAQPLRSQLVKIALTSPTKSIKKPIERSNIKDGYTLQLLASHNKADLFRYMQSHQLMGKTKMRHFTNNKGSWYILTLGEYSSWSQAQQASRQLDKQFAKLNPWIRPVAGLSNVG